ncbi:metal ABC transporter solute-binding protein, Zn/Mn family [Pyrococcus sp. ST04]|uniref:metal ABC transporter solute-binding protein, Zn/Mn family n=1 Tax=Pyrococcus sp. ST04 TaxID=1183377 RepID=UPI0002605AE7|nr:zinc ABC transporter substrate-binding protein [Pyrococcus sp. ST04]AFK22168.1 ABC transporter periplasmic binding protein [Pyrococcus sp. ST04]
MRRLIPLLLIVLLLHPVAAQEKKPLVVTSLPPLASIIKEALGDYVQVVYLVPPGVEPHQYQLSPDQIRVLKEADVIVTTGHLPAEMKIIELKKEGEIAGTVLTIDDYRKYGFRYLPERWYTGKNNPHGIWLDPTNAVAIAEATAEAIAERNPGIRSGVEESVSKFKERVNSIVLAYSGVLKGKKAVIELPSQQYALEWLGVEVVASIKPEAEVPAKSVDELSNVNADVIVYDEGTPQTLKNAAIKLSQRLGIPVANITVLWTEKPYTKVLLDNTRSIISSLTKERKVVIKEGGFGYQYSILALIIGLVVGISIGVVIRRCPVL